jgi:hypothetical protein
LKLKTISRCHRIQYGANSLNQEMKPRHFSISPAWRLLTAGYVARQIIRS